MTRNSVTVIILSISLLVFCTACLISKPLITGTYDEETVETIHNISKIKLGEKFLKHYSKQLITFSQLRIGPYKDLLSYKVEKRAFMLAGLIFAGMMSLFISLVSLVLFLMHGSRKPEPAISKKTLFIILALVILNGTAIRLVLASTVYGEWDIQSYEIVANIVLEGGNVYAETIRYNYSPVWFTTLSVLKRIQLQFPILPFHFIVKFFLCGIDLLLLVFLLLIARYEKISMIKTSIFFYLNPISFLTTGFQGQFEGFAVLMVVIGLFAYLALKCNRVLGTTLLWFFATAGMIVKHSIFYELIICLNFAIRRYWLKILLFSISVCIFLALFLPYWDSGDEGFIKAWKNREEAAVSAVRIIRNVFLYSSGNDYQEPYGIMSLFNLPSLKYVFIVGMFAFPFFLKSKDVVSQYLSGVLFFLVFTTGIWPQYFVLPIALGALRPSRGSFFFSLAGSLFMLGFINYTFIPVLHLVRLNIVWYGAIYWFIMQLYNDRGKSVLLANGK